VALQQGRQPIVEMLLEAGADPAARDAWGRTPLLVAAQLRNTAAIARLIEKKSDVNAANKNDITPLVASAQTGNREAAAMLLAAGARADAADNLGWTALMWAAYRKDEPLVRLLLEHGADAGTVGRDKSTALGIAKSRGGSASLVALLASRTRAESSIERGTEKSPGAQPVAVATSRVLRPEVDPTRIVRGSPTAPITVFEYTDFQCPYCAYGARTIEEVLARYEGQVRLIVKHLPLPKLHPMAMACAVYFEALSMQSPALAWGFYDRIFADQAALSGGEKYLGDLAAQLGADMSRLAKDLMSKTVGNRIAADLKESEAFKFDGVPAFIVNGRPIEGAQPADRFSAVIEALGIRE
jgi:protein-disulfide isomerase